MAAANFKRALAAVLVHEGGYSNHPADPGGVTLEGVIQRVYDGYRARKGLPKQRLTLAMRGTPAWIAERDDIYRRQYWDACRCDELPPGVDFVVFDGAVNSGPYQSTLWLQRALGAPVDGHVGENTLRMAREHRDHDALVADILRRRLGMLQALKTWPTFGKGWSRRVNSVKALGQAWAAGSVGPAPVYEPTGIAKAYASDVAQAPLPEEAAQGGAFGGAGIAALVQAAKEPLAPLVGTSDFVTHVFTALTLVAVTIAVIGAVATWMAKRKNAKARAAIDGALIAEFDAAENGAAA